MTAPASGATGRIAPLAFLTGSGQAAGRPVLG